MKSIKYVIYREDEFYVAQALNVEVSSFGDTPGEAIANLQDAVSLYFKDESFDDLYHAVDEAMIGEAIINA